MAFLTDFFSFFMIVATAATLFINHIVLDSGERAALAIAPFAGKIASQECWADQDRHSNLPIAWYEYGRVQKKQ